MTGRDQPGHRATGLASAGEPLAVGEPEPPSTADAPSPPGLARFFAFQTVAEFSFTGGIWILYLRHRGFSLAEIGLAESVFHLAPITLELPSGSFADVIGRKSSLVAGALLIAASAALMLRADSLWLLLPAMYLNGAAYAFRSGATQAFLYDSLAAGEESGRFTGLWGKLLSASYVVFAATTWLGAALAERDFAWPYGLTVASGLAAAWLASGLREPERERAVHRGMAGTIREALGLIRGKPGLARLLVFGAVLFTLSTLVALYAQAVLAEQGLPPSRVGLVIGVTFLCTAVGSWFAGRLGGRWGFRTWTPLVTLAIVGAALGMGSGVLALAVGLYLLAEFVTGVFEPLLAAAINEGLPGAQRATILSVEGFLFSFTMVWAFPLFGVAAERFGWLAAYALAALVPLALLGPLLRARNG